MENNNPLDLLKFWDFAVCLFAIFVRFLAVAKKKSDEVEDFSFKSYFDFKHVLRWVFHLSTSICLLLVLPELFLVYISPNFLNGNFEAWGLFGSALVGFIGYDFIKIVERVTISTAKKAGVDIEPPKERGITIRKK